MTNQVITSTQANAESVVNYATGLLTGDAGTPAAFTLPIGFKPRYAMLLCIASSVTADVGRSIEWFDGMADNNALVTTVAGGGGAASKSISTTLGPVVAGTTPNNGEPRQITWPAGAFDVSSSYVYQIEG